MSIVTENASGFALVVGQGKRLAALDIGTKTIGLATSSAATDFAAAFATARETLRRGKPGTDMETLRAWFAREMVAGLVVGLPRNMDGSDSQRTQSVRAQARNLARETGLPVFLWDERWSTMAVERALIAADVSRARRAGRIDALAAAHILEGALNRLARAGSGSY